MMKFPKLIITNAKGEYVRIECNEDYTLATPFAVKSLKEGYPIVSAVNPICDFDNRFLVDHLNKSAENILLDGIEEAFRLTETEMKCIYVD